MNLATGDIYVLSKHAYVEEKWEFICDFSKATKMGDIMAVISSDKFLKSICRSLKEIHEVKVSEETLQEILIDKIFKDGSKMNKNLLKKLNAPELKIAQAALLPDVPPPIPTEGLEKKTA